MGQQKSKSKMDFLFDLKPKYNTFTEDYDILDKKLGCGINGSVVACLDRSTKIEYALKV